MVSLFAFANEDTNGNFQEFLVSLKKYNGDENSEDEPKEMSKLIFITTL